MNRLNIVAVEEGMPRHRPTSFSLQTTAKLNHLWKEGHYTPNKERLEANWELLQTLDANRILDVGCGEGTLVRRLHAAGANVTALDGSSIPLKPLAALGIPTLQGCLPHLRLDQRYDLVICTEVLGELEPIHYRLAFSQLADLLEKDGLLVCSTSLDTATNGALERFLTLACTEFQILKWKSQRSRIIWRRSPTDVLILAGRL